VKLYSVTRRLIVTVLLLELLSALALTWLAVAFEGHTRFRSFDVALRSRADTLFGSVGDADDPSDSLVLDLHNIQLPPSDMFEVEGADGKVLGRSTYWPAEKIDAVVAAAATDGIYPVTLGNRTYHFVILHAVRVVDPDGRGGGIKRPVVIRYGASTEGVWKEVWEAVRFYAVASLLLLTATGFAMAWFLRRGLAPLSELAREAARFSAQQWQFHPGESARAMIELAPLTSALETTLKRLQRSFEQQRRFTSDAAHELKTDLATAKSSLQLLMMRRRSPEEYQRGLEVCLADTLRIERTVTEMLTLARVEYEHESAGAAERRSHSDLAKSLTEGVNQFESFARLRQLSVRVDSPGQTQVGVSEEDSRLLCINLLLNAMQHSRPLTDVSAVLRETEGWVLLIVSDQGEGISPEALPHVFEPFYRSDAARDRRSGGTGLGLAICKGICEKAGGDISIRSQFGEGTQVTARLPSAAGAAYGLETSPEFSRK
jgi:signal transduction histidine kinase